MNDPKHLAGVVHEMHGCRATHIRSEPVRERFNGETTWEGVVEVFDTVGHPDASRVYAWSYLADNRTVQHQAVLGVPPINSAVDAVRAAAVEQAQRTLRSR